MEKLFSFCCDCGRMGSLDGLFIATQEAVDSLVGKYVHFGEVLGKHSDVGGTIEAGDITLVSDDQDKVEWLKGLLGYSISGYNPFDYYDPEEDEDEEE